MKKYSITTVVVTYNRKELLLNNLMHQLAQSYKIDHILIIDNHSSDGTKAFLSEHGILNLRNVRYFYLPDNLGGAGGFQYGVERSREVGDDLVVLMDDDGYFCNKNALEILVHHIPENRSLIMMNSLVTADESRLSFWLEFNIDGRLTKLYNIKQCLQYSENDLIEDRINPFNGTIISQNLIKKIGYPNGAFFIRGDEADYQSRAAQAGAYIATVTSSRYHHPPVQIPEQKTILGITFENTYAVPWKEYYATRNYLYRMREHGRIYTLLRYLRRRIGVMLFDVPDKKMVIAFMKKGYQDAIKGNMGKQIQPGQKKLDC